MTEVRGFQAKTSLGEMTVGEFERFSEVLNNAELDYIDKYLEILRIQGMTEETIEEITDEDLFAFIGEIAKDDRPAGELIPNVEMEGYNYVAYTDEKFSMKAKDLGLIESYVKKSPNGGYFALALAVIFKREDLTRVEHYTPAHIEHKAKLVRALPVELVYPYIVHIAQTLGRKIEMIKQQEDEAAE